MSNRNCDKAIARWLADKRLRALLREKKRLEQSIHDAGHEELEVPFQRGWERWFDWGDEARRRRDFAILDGALEIIQNRQWSRFLDFRAWHWRLGRMLPMTHELGVHHAHSLMRVCRDPAQVKYFGTSRYRKIEGWEHLKELRRMGWGGPIQFLHPELLRVRVDPYWVTRIKICLPDAESRIAEIEGEMESFGGWGRIGYLKGWRKWKPTSNYERSRRLDQLAWKEILEAGERVEFEKGADGSAPFSFLMQSVSGRLKSNGFKDWIRKLNPILKRPPENHGLWGLHGFFLESNLRDPIRAIK